jgi:hypothetical protein
MASHLLFDRMGDYSILRHPKMSQIEMNVEMVKTFGPGSKDLGFDSRSHPIALSPLVHRCSSICLSKAEWCTCALGSFEKRGNPRGPGILILAKV